MERMYPLVPGARIEKINRGALGIDYTVPELRQLAADNEVPVPARALKDEIIAALTAAGVDLPPKPVQRMPPYRRRRGPEAGQ